MLEEYLRQAGFLLDQGCLPWQIDRAMENFGFSMGPFRMIDMAGNEISWATGDLICELGRFGQKCGSGWYDYRPGDRTAHPSKEVQALLEGHLRRLGLSARPIGEREIVDRLTFALINEGANVLEDHIASRASDIDLIYLYGYGFPEGQSWVPAPLLCRLAASGGRFNS